MRIKLLAVVSLGLLGLSLYTPGVRAGTSDENYLFGLINKQRTSGTATNDRYAEEQRRRRRRHRRPRPPATGAATLIEHPVILDEVRAHSQDMAQRDSLDHVGFDARVARIRAADGGISGHICENVATVTGTGQAALDRIFRLWMESAPHRRCMLDLDAKSQSAAVGVVQDGDALWATFVTAADATP